MKVKVTSSKAPLTEGNFVSITLLYARNFFLSRKLPSQSCKAGPDETNLRTTVSLCTASCYREVTERTGDGSAACTVRKS